MYIYKYNLSRFIVTMHGKIKTQKNEFLFQEISVLLNGTHYSVSTITFDNGQKFIIMTECLQKIETILLKN